mmetsp:Transcript_7169/g.18366  ORF Transcript_7169/g.18366 Transcript_7169/m.18366 type:complete len:212 (+) Transcript_7169:240-875(+)
MKASSPSRSACGASERSWTGSCSRRWRRRRRARSARCAWRSRTWTGCSTSSTRSVNGASSLSASWWMCRRHAGKRRRAVSTGSRYALPLRSATACWRPSLQPWSSLSRIGRRRLARRRKRQARPPRAESSSTMSPRAMLLSRRATERLTARCSMTSSPWQAGTRARSSSASASSRAVRPARLRSSSCGTSARTAWADCLWPPLAATWAPAS